MISETEGHIPSEGTTASERLLKADTEGTDAVVSKSQQVATYTVYVVTYNVGSRFPDNISLRKLLDLEQCGDTKQHLHDIYAIGLQEVNSQPQQQVLGLFKEDPWVQKVKDILCEYDYVGFKTEQMQGLLLTLFIKREHLPHLSEIEAEFTRTGFGGIWGNKGAVSVRFNLFGCGLTFIAAHLAAHDHHLDERIEDYKQIMENHHYHVARYREIHDHDYVFWFGDLNFRLHGEEEAETIRDAVVKDDKLEDLFEKDQLTYVRVQTQEAFQLLHERPPAFPPTFKFKEGTSEYDMKRRPAWTDRILYAVQPLNRQPNMPLTIEQHSYKSHPAYCISDHKPVTSDFSIKLYPNYRVPAVVFRDITIWTIGDENTVAYLRPLDFEERAHDWIGVFPVKFSSLNEHTAYEYVSQAESPPSPSTPTEEYFDGPSTHRHHHHRYRQRLRRQQQANAEDIHIDFSEDIRLKHGREYVLIYLQNTGIRGVTSIGGISNPFRAEKKPRSRRSSRSHSRSRTPSPH